MGNICAEDVLLIGRVIRPHGLKGLLRIDSFAESEGTFLNAGEVFLEEASGKTVKHRVVSVTPSNTYFLLNLEGLDTREQAEAYRDKNIYIERSKLSRQRDEFFWFELIGMPVYLDTGRRLGVVRQIVPAPGHDIYVVQEGDKEILIPAVFDVVKEVDLAGGKIVITGMEGLLDLNEV